MINYTIKKAKTDVSVTIRIIDSTDGTPETGVVAATSGLVLNYRREGAANVSLATITNLAALTTAHTDKGILHIGNGYYRVDLPDAACADGADGVLVHGVVTGMVVIGCYIELVAYDPQDTVRLGLTALPNAVPDTSGGLPTEDADGNIAASVINLSTSSAALNFPVTADNTAGAIVDGITFVGTQTGTFANTEANLATFHQISHATDAFDLVYRVPCGAIRTAVSLNIDAYLNGGNDVANIQVYDHVGADWETLQVINGQAGATPLNFSLPLFEKHTGAVGGGEDGNVYVRFVTSGQTAPELFIARVSAAAVLATSSMGYEAGAVWIDETSGNSTGTSPGIDGIVTNRSNDFDNAQTIAAAVGLRRLYVARGNSITLTATLNNYAVGIPGASWTLALGGQDVGGCTFSNATITGIGTGTPCDYRECLLGAVTLPPSTFFGCGLGNGSGTFTLGSAGAYRFINCHSSVAGTGAPVVDLGAAVGASTVEFRRWSGGLTLNNVQAGDVVSVDVISGGTVTVNGTGGDVAVRGMCTVVDGSGGSVTITTTGVVNVNTVADGVWDELTTEHIAVNTFGQRLSVLETGTAVAATSTTITLDGGSSELADFYNGAIIVITAGTGAGQSRIISDYAVTTNVATVDAWVTTPSTDSVYYIVPFGTIPGATAPTAGQVADAVWDEAQADHVGAGSFGLIASEIADILVDTAEIGTAGAGLTDLASQASVDTIDGIVDAIKLSTDNLPPDPADQSLIIAATDANLAAINALNDASPAAIADAVWDEARNDHVTPGSFGEPGSTVVSGLVNDAAASTTAFVTNLGEATNDHFIGRNIMFTTGALKDQGSDIVDYDGTTKTITVTALTEAPANGVGFVIT